MKSAIIPSCRVTIVAVISFLLWPAAASAIVIYHVTDLGTLGGSASFALGINNSGQVVGFSATISNPAGVAFRTKPNSVINPATDNLGTLGGSTSAANAINDLGQVVGYSYVTATTTHAFRAAPNAKINPATDDLGTLGGQNSYALGINDLGQVVGDSSVGVNDFAFCTAPNAAINPTTDNLGGFGGTFSFASSINNNGQITGTANLPGDAIGHAFRIDGRRALRAATDDIGNSVGGGSFAGGINESGQIVGSAIFGGTQNNPFRIGPNASINPLTDNLGRPAGSLDAEFTKINEAGWAVGLAEEPSNTDIALLYDGTMLINLNNVLDSSGAGWILNVANDINDHNQIAGYGTISGATHAFRLDLVPEPSTLSLLTITMLIIFADVRRKSVPHNRV